MALVHTLFCYNDVDLIDTPGMNDMDDMNAVTVSQLEDIDLAVVAIDAQYPYSETENRFVVKLLESKMICQIIFVITHFDMIRNREKQKLYNFLHSRIQKNVLDELNKNYKPGERIFQKYHVIFDHLHLYGVSSPDAMEALETNDMELYEKSGFLQLSKELPQIILRSQSVNMIDNIVTLLEEMIGEYEAAVKNEEGGWKQAEMFGKKCSYLFDAIIREMGESISDECKQGWETLREHQAEELTNMLLNSLGSVRTLTVVEIQKAMIPVMQQEFDQANRYFENLKKRTLDKALQKWRSVLSRFVADVKDEIKQLPRLQIEMQAENDKIFALPYRQFQEGPADNHSQDVYMFYWVESPIQAVYNTKENQSVLPGIQRIVVSDE